MILLHTQTYLKRGEIQAESSVIRLIYLRTFVHLNRYQGYKALYETSISLFFEKIQKASIQIGTCIMG